MDEFEKAELEQSARAEKFRQKAPEQYGVVSRIVDIYSDGTRMSATIWRPKGVESKPLPAILLCHGFGAKRSHLDYSYAPRFAQAGFVALTFDYRGWGDSDGIVISAEKQPKPDPQTGLVNIKAKIIRK